LDDAIRDARDSDTPTLIEVEIPRDDVSPQLITIGREVARVRGWKPAAPAKHELLNHC